MSQGYRPKGNSNSEEFELPNHTSSVINYNVDIKKENISEDFAKRLQEHQNICDYLHDLYFRKNSDYGGSVTDTFNKYGLVSFLVRLEDKLNRARSLNQKGNAKVKEESILDTLYDLANYSMLAIIELKMQKRDDL